MVKTLHLLSDISHRIVADGDRRVRVERSAGGATPAAIDPAAAALAALADPLDFPPLAAATVPGDQVAIALDAAVPCAVEVLRGTIDTLRQAGIDSDAISVVSSDGALVELCRAELNGGVAADVRFLLHDPQDERELCFVGATERQQRLLINRTIFDADVVLPIGVARLGDGGVYDGLFPQFSTAEAIERYRIPADRESAASQAACRRETDEAGWLVGAPLVVRVVPGGDETVAHVVAGEAAAVAARTELLCRGRWSYHVARRASLVIATVSGGAREQSWENIGRAAAAAERLVADGGAVAICSNLDQPLGESLSRLVGSSDLENTARQVFHEHADDSWPAWQLARAIDRGPVYLLSQLDAELVEDLGLAPMADVREVVRLAGRHESYIIVDDSQHAAVTVDGEETE